MKKVLRFLVLALFILVGVSSAVAQLSDGTILGIVKDASGGVVPGAKITVRNEDTSLTRTAESSIDGSYRMPSMPVGRYSVRIEKEGFRTETQTGFVLDVSQELVVNLALTVGTSTQEVVVTGEAPLVNTTTSSLGGLVNEQKITDLPLNGRNYIDLSLMQAGITQNTSQGNSSGAAGVWFSSNGAPVRSNYFTLDGAPMNNGLSGAATSQAGTTLGVDGIREYRIVTNAFSADYGMTMGSQMVIVSKGGSNRFTGDVFEYLRNSALDARNFFDYGYQTPGAPRLPPFQRNNFGAALGGPIKKDKTFFFGVYEGLRQNLGFTALDTVPAAGCHGPANAVIWNGAGTQPAGSIGPCPQLGLNAAPNQNLPLTVTIAPVMAPLLALYPNPNLVSTNQFTLPTSNKARVDYGQMRVDQNLSASDSLFVRFTIDDATVNNGSAALGNSSTGVAFPQYFLGSVSRNQFLTLSETHIISPMLLNTTRLSFARTAWTIANIFNTPLTGPQYSFLPGLPLGSWTITGLTGFGPNQSFGPPDIYTKQDVFAFSDDLYYTRGKHALKFGTLINAYYDGLQNGRNSRGLIAFSSLNTFLKGTPSSYQGLSAGSNLNRYFRFNTLGFYVQDDWRTSSRLTVNLGFRYEIMTTINELNGRGYAFRNILTDPLGTQGPPIRNYTLHNYSPRVGFAYDLFGNGKTSIRSAFGIYYDVGNVGPVLNQATGATPPVSGIGTINNPPGVLTLPLTFSSTVSALTNEYNASQPHTLQYNLTVEQQLPGLIGLSVSYVGSRGLNLWGTTEGNPRPPTSITNGVQFWGPLDNGSGTGIDCTAVVPTCRINRNLAGVLYYATLGESWYSGLQVTVNKRVSHGLEFQAAYTWAHSLDDGGGGAQGSSDCGTGGVYVYTQFKNLDKGSSCFDLTQNLRFNLLYHLPTWTSSKFLGKIVNGWSMGNIISVHGGYPFTPFIPIDRARSGALAGLAGFGVRPDLGTEAVAAGQADSHGVVNNTISNFVPFDPKKAITGNPNNWFNPLMFRLTPLGFMGTASRAMLRGPGAGTWDFSLTKDTALHLLGERGSVQFRAEIFNILNRANFGSPSVNVFGGAVTTTIPYQAPPSATAASPFGTVGQITTTDTSSRQVQLALKVLF